MATKRLAIQITAETIRHVEDVCQHYRWKPSQAIAEYVRFFHRLEEYACRFSVFTAPNGERMLSYVHEDGSADPIEGDNAAVLLGELLAELRKGMLAAFRPPVELDGFDESEGVD